MGRMIALLKDKKTGGLRASQEVLNEIFRELNEGI